MQKFWCIIFRYLFFLSFMFTESNYISGSRSGPCFRNGFTPCFFCNRIHVVSGTRCDDGSCSVVGNILQKEITVCF